MLPEQLRNARLVVIDDVAPNLRLLESSLRTFGAQDVVTFSDSAEGLAWLTSNHWDLLLLDLDMPQPDGFAILSALQERDRAAAPIIIVTALTQAEQRRRGLELGANDFICKPLDLPELLLRVRNNLQLAMAGQQLAAERDSLERAVHRRTEQLRESHQAQVRSLIRAAGFKDNETGNHILRIGEAAALIAEALGSSPDWVEQLRLAACMHDVGKIGVPDDVLTKPGRLSDDEREIMKHHSRIGFEILHDSNGSYLSELAAEIALYHHEYWDGSGYPHGLKGEEIPLSARIVALCDVYDALRTPRVYKAAWSPEQARRYIEEQAGRHFDPELVPLMLAVLPQIEALQRRLPDDESPDPAPPA